MTATHSIKLRWQAASVGSPLAAQVPCDDREMRLSHFELSTSRLCTIAILVGRFEIYLTILLNRNHATNVKSFTSYLRQLRARVPSTFDS